VEAGVIGVRTEEGTIIRGTGPDARQVAGDLDGDRPLKVALEAADELLPLRLGRALVQTGPFPVRAGPPAPLAQRESPTLAIEDERALGGI
jgi:hypothetical protein